MADVQQPVLAISKDDTAFHVGPPGLPSHLGEPGHVADLDYFDATGVPLERTEDGSLAPKPGVTPPDDLDRQILVDRVAAVLAHRQVQLDHRVRDALIAGTTPPTPRRLPRVDGQLADVLATIAELAGTLPSAFDPNPGSAWHEFWYH